jgi:hypothetical protein
MRYGFNVYFEDNRGYLFKFYSIYSVTKDQAEQEFRLEKIRRNYSNLKIKKIKEATQFEWEHYEIHGDVWHSPFAKYGIPRKERKRA